MVFRAGGKSTTFKMYIGKLKDKVVEQEFSSVIASNLRNNIQLGAEDAEVEDTWEVVKDSVEPAACEVLGLFIKGKAK
jgi:ABC-type transport system involved in cytochrome bd biosynthesis fused ATPase/permease subunit